MSADIVRHPVCLACIIGATHLLSPEPIIANLPSAAPAPEGSYGPVNLHQGSEAQLSLAAPSWMKRGLGFSP